MAIHAPHERHTEFPPPGLDGTYRDSCVVCYRGTDTGLALTGEGEWIIARLGDLGMPLWEAACLISDVTGCDPGNVPVGDVTLLFRICRDCASKVEGGGPRVDLIAKGELPHYRQPPDRAGRR